MRNSKSDRRWGVKGFCGAYPLFAAASVAAASVAAASVAAASVAAADFHPGYGLLAGAVFGVAGVYVGAWRCGLAWLLCGWLAVGGFVWRDGLRRADERALLLEPAGQVRGQVMKDARVIGRWWSAPVRLCSGGRPGAKVLWQGSGEAPVAGAVLSARGKFGPLPEVRNPGEFDRGGWLRRQGVAAVFHAKSGESVETGPWALLGARIRHGFRERVTAGLREDSQEANVIRAVVIGESPSDADDLIAVFRNSGTLHVFSVSGLHVAMVGGIGWLLMSWLGLPRRWAIPALLSLMFGYSWITGNSAPAVRSAWMAAVFLGAFVFRRRPDLLNALGAVLLAAMLWDGKLLFQAGVQLSYGVVAAITVGAGLATKVFAWMAVPETYLPEWSMTRWQASWLKLRNHIAQSFGVSVAAALGSAPLTAFHFGVVTPVSVLANLVLVPLVFILLVLGLAAVALSPMAPVARGVNQLNAWVADASVLAAEAFSAIPGGHFHVGGASGPMLLVYDLDHGAGATCFSGGAGGAVLLDCGDPRSFKFVVMPSLRKLGIEPDSVVLSHPDGGHLGGGSAVWQAFPIRQALMPVREARSLVYRSWIDDGGKAGIRQHQVVAPEWHAFPDGASLEVLYAPDSQASHGIADDRVAIFRLHWRGWKLLLTSDAGMGVEQKLLESGKDVAADLIIAGHHRRDLTLCDAFLDAVHPQAIIASNSRIPAEERLDPRTVDYWKSRGIHVFDQAATGGVTVRVEATGNLRIDGFLSASPLVLKAR